EYEQRLMIAANSEINVVLQPASRHENTTVTATRTPLPATETGASVDVVSQKELQSSGGVMLSDRLRQVLGFSSFRRSSSLAINPTAEGVSLRGVGSSGASRALVLLDGVPISDPFGGWIYWDQIPELAVSSVEVLRGGASGLYGSDAMGGVVNILSRPPEHFGLDVQGSLGGTLLRNGEAYASGSTHGWSASASGQALSTDGYYIVPDSIRGAVDTRSTVDFRNALGTLERNLPTGKVFFGGSLLAESRNNGTHLQLNDTHLGRLVAGADFAPESIGSINLRVFGAGERFHQTFSSIALDRSTEALTRLQTAPSDELGTSAQWSRRFGRHSTVGGFDFSNRNGHTSETVISSGRATSVVDSGGRTRNYGYFGEDVVTIGSRLVLTASLRGDTWNNGDGHSDTTPLVATVTPSQKVFAERTDSAFSPRLSALYNLHGGVALTAAFYRAFRAPTLNELYRAFRVGNVVTQANSALVAEQLTGGEAGVRANIAGVTTRAVFFVNSISNPVANVTLSTTPTLITRQRQNLGATRSLGVEAEAEWRIRRVVLSGGYQFTSATVTDFSVNPALVGRWVPQVPQHQFTAQARYTSSRWTLAAQARAAGTQYDDDQNLLPLDPYFSLDLFVSRSISRHVDLYFAGENVTGQRATVGRTPSTTIGPPAILRGGVRLHFGRG
ncbi:MAG TPA: TonB-dependent receptor, partial [Terriglobales bacterium]